MGNVLHHARRRGFTLIEVMIAVLILGLVLAAISGVVRTGVRAWRTGHAASEISQTVRITQDVVLRDLDNMFYMSETSYNIAFRAQLDNLARLYGAQLGSGGNMSDMQRVIDSARGGKSRRRSRSRRNAENGERSALDDLSLETIAPPLDLSFRGSDARLSFTRTYRPRFTGDQDTGGIRRVTYFIRDKVLYRREEDPYGLRPGLNSETSYQGGLYAAAPPRSRRASRRAGRNNPSAGYDNSQYDPIQAIRAEFEKLYAIPDDEDADRGGGEAEPASNLLPNQVRIEEPLCAGVESLKIKYGFFKAGEWDEDQTWDSHARQHRAPPLEDEMAGMPGAGNQQPLFGVPFTPPMQPTTQPDDLPGYITLKLGVTGPDGKGRPYSFVIHHSIPRAIETDILVEDQDGKYSTRNYHTNFGRR